MSSEEKFISITISFPASMIKFLDEEAGRKDRNRSQIVREAVRKYKGITDLQLNPPVSAKGNKKAGKR